MRRLLLLGIILLVASTAGGCQFVATMLMTAAGGVDGADQNIDGYNELTHSFVDTHLGSHDNDFYIEPGSSERIQNEAYERRREIDAWRHR